MAEKIFVDGMVVKKRENAPSYVLGSLSIKVDEFRNFLTKNQESEWMNIDLLKSKKGTYYAALNDWKPEKREEAQSEAKAKPTEIEYPEEEPNVSDIPF